MKEKNSINSNPSNLAFYKAHDFAKPFIGHHFSANSLKLLLIGESHYLSSYEGIPSVENWYSNSENCTTNFLDKHPKNKDWLNPNYIIGTAFFDNHGHTSFGIFRNPAQCVQKELHLTDFKEAMHHMAFYNYFLRPAEKKGDSIKVSPEDKKQSFDHFLNVLEILKPKQVIFTSTKAYKAFKETVRKRDQKIDVSIEKTCHPSSAWWNRETASYGFSPGEKLTGKARFTRIIKKSIS